MKTLFMPFQYAEQVGNATVYTETIPPGSSNKNNYKNASCMS